MGVWWWGGGGYYVNAVYNISSVLFFWRFKSPFFLKLYNSMSSASFQLVFPKLVFSVSADRESRDRICKRLWSPGIDSKDSICLTGLPGYIGWRNRRFLGIDFWAPWPFQIRAPDFLQIGPFSKPVSGAQLTPLNGGRYLPGISEKAHYLIVSVCFHVISSSYFCFSNVFKQKFGGPQTGSANRKSANLIMNIGGRPMRIWIRNTDFFLARIYNLQTGTQRNFADFRFTH